MQCARVSTVSSSRAPMGFHSSIRPRCNSLNSRTLSPGRMRSSAYAPCVIAFFWPQAFAPFLHYSINTPAAGRLSNTIFSIAAHSALCGGQPPNHSCSHASFPRGMGADEAARANHAATPGRFSGRIGSRHVCSGHTHGASGFNKRNDGKRAKSPSVEHSVSPCSSDSAAKCASGTRLACTPGSASSSSNRSA